MTSLEPTTNHRLLGFAKTVSSSPARSEQPTSVLDAVQDAVRRMDIQTLRRVASPDAGLAFQPVALLALLTYCYAHEIYGSSQVEELMCKDASFRKICAQEFPGARIIQRFRKENREAMHECLCAALSRQFTRNATAGRLPSLPEDQIPEEATRRILMAMFIDNVELNDG
jgi:hypothetical protein